MARIWILEDDENVALLLRDATERMGHAPERFQSAAQLEARLKESSPDLLLDLMLRGKNGLEVLAEWKEKNMLLKMAMLFFSDSMYKTIYKEL